jgi:hypothetical protein
MSEAETAKFKFWPSFNIATLIPTTCERVFSTGPPDEPCEMGAVI